VIDRGERLWHKTAPLLDCAHLTGMTRLRTSRLMKDIRIIILDGQHGLITKNSG
jgi:hypothetical protein